MASTLVALESLKKLDAVDFGDEFEAMLDARKAAHAGGDRRRFGASKERGEPRRQNIFEIVFAAQPDVGAASSSGVSWPSRRKTI